MDRRDKTERMWLRMRRNLGFIVGALWIMTAFNCWAKGLFSPEAKQNLLFSFGFTAWAGFILLAATGIRGFVRKNYPQDSVRP
jgi:hypothetical protein